MSFLKTIETIIRGKELPPLPNKPIFGYNHKPKKLSFRQPVSFEEVTKEIEESASSTDEQPEEKKSDYSHQLIDELDANYWLLYLQTATQKGIASRDAVTALPQIYYGHAEIMLEFIRLEPAGIIVASKDLVNNCTFLKAAYQIAPSIIERVIERDDIEKQAMDFLMREEEIDTMARSVKLNYPAASSTHSH
ncbi:hypothetical protein [Paraburkholderia fungorum]|jgi:hypothetical protein|uniref:hypothetical protein n=1 Tax=Paraburkholderia fungorum TaxID=134537 RepID=UPI000D07A68E|nr:hypothetical protein [Paraburkholderia fungorum]PRZ50687.1 hypothetical protein BX589_124125 [Paraburkholderia fungorum]